VAEEEVKVRDQVITKTKMIEEQLELIELGSKRVENAKKIRVT